MDYEKMLRFHIEKKAECTIAVLDVPLKEASRFGIMNTADDDSIYEFEEKPKKPKSTKASMGVYLFNWNVLREYLIADENDPDSSNDFGKNVIPALLGDRKRLFAYKFEGYWKDVGTIESLWEANMDLLSGDSALSLDDNESRVYARNYDCPPTYFYDGAKLSGSMITKGCEI